jgi:uncharacterized protein
MSPVAFILKYYSPESEAYSILLRHCQAVTHKAVGIAMAHPELKADTGFIAEAAMLHDIGIFLTDAPSLGCHGKHQYIEHGYLGADLLRNEGFPKHALVCERHTGTGLSVEEIVARRLPLPHRDMQPVSIEEKIICFADKFFSKSKNDRELSLAEVRQSIARFGPEGSARFDGWARLFLSLDVVEFIGKPEA